MKPKVERSGYHVLVVDDDPHVALVLERLIEAEGHAVRRARDGREALDLVRQRPPDLVLLDLDMPELGGFEVCRQIKQDPQLRLTPVVIITAQSAAEARLRAWEQGADDFLNKPFAPVEVVARCRSLLRVKSLIDELDCAQSVVFALARAIEAKSPYTQGHSERVTVFALALAARLGLSTRDSDVLRRGGSLHDIGKIAIPDSILNKPAKLTPEEYQLVKSHPLEGVRIVDRLRSVRDAVPLIRWHHERLDGGGYPDGLFGGGIPLLVRVLAVADVYDALASERPYRPGMPLEQCLAVMQQDASRGGLDPELVRAFGADPVIPLGVAAMTAETVH